jgi:predicted NBD/HSP70 family sugar kinase
MLHLNHNTIFQIESKKSESEKVSRRLSYHKSIIGYLYYQTQASVNEIVNHTGLSQPHVAELLKELSQVKIIKEIGKGISKGGRPPKIYALVPNYKYVIGVDVNLHHMSIAIFNLDNQVIFRKDYSSFDLESTVEYTNRLAQIIVDSMTEMNLAITDIIACSLSLPGLVDAVNGKSITHLSVFPEGISKYLESKLHMPVILENDCKMMAMGENSFGKAKEMNSAICLKIGSGIGLGIIIDGKIYRGADGFAGEFGHILIDPNGDLCHCGKVGCLETLCSGSILTQKVNRAIEKGQVTTLSKYKTDQNDISLSQIVNAINSGDSYAIDELTKAADHLGKGLVTLIHILNPEAIIMGGKLAHTRKNIIDPLKSSLNKYTMPEFRKKVKISCSDLLDESTLLGTMAYTMQMVFESNK